MTELVLAIVFAAAIYVVVVKSSPSARTVAVDPTLVGSDGDSDDITAVEFFWRPG